MNKDLILITGIPGTGKTSIADFLRDNHGYDHIDLEDMQHKGIFPQNFIAFQQYISQLPKNKKTVLTWGFPPSVKHYIDHIVNSGYTLIWLDGNRVSSFREFMIREGHSINMELAYHIQLQAIISSNIVTLLNPKVINPFDNNGTFKKKEDIVLEILNA